MPYVLAMVDSCRTPSSPRCVTRAAHKARPRMACCFCCSMASLYIAVHHIIIGYSLRRPWIIRGSVLPSAQTRRPGRPRRLTSVLQRKAEMTRRMVGVQKKQHAGGRERQGEGVMVRHRIGALCCIAPSFDCRRRQTTGGQITTVKRTKTHVQSVFPFHDA